MNYLKKYRQEAGLSRTNENVAYAPDRSQTDITPTKQTLMYLREAPNVMPKQKSSVA